MGKDMMIDMLKSQLETANATNLALNLTIQSLNSTIAELRQTVTNLENLLKQKEVSLSKAGNEIRGLNALAFKKSEKQVAVPEIKSEDQLQQEKEQKAAAIKARGNNGAKRKEHFELETIEKDIYPEDINKEICVEIGVRDAIRYSMIPPKFIKTIYHIHTLKQGDTVYAGKTPLTPLLNSSFDGSFIAGIAELRYLYSMPVERIVKYFQSHGFNIDKQTAHGLLSKTASLVDNLYKAMQIAIKEDGYLNCDESYHTVLVKSYDNNGKGSKKGYIWVIVAAHTGLVYCFYEDGSRKQDVILNKLDGYCGIVQSDGLGAYKKLAQVSNGKITRVACLQHCKRDFLDDSLKDNADAQRVVCLANKLYQKEHEHTIGEDGWTVEDNLMWRQQYAPPILAALKTELEAILENKAYPPKSLMHKAANYFLNEWDGIEAIASYGDVAWDNNLIERTNRYIALSRHNSLFFGSDAGAERGCIFYSLACSCRNRGIDFFEYLSDVLNKSAEMPNGTPSAAYRDLLPDKWKQ